MKNLVLRTALAAVLVGPCVLSGLTPAKALPVTWDFIDPVSNPGPGLLGTSATFVDQTTGTFGITAYGITNASYLPVSGPAPAVGSTVTTFASPTLTALYVKNGGTGENGLGLNNDVNKEIKQGNLIEIATNPNVISYNFKMNSTTNGEGWDVYGSNSNAAVGVAVLKLLYSDGLDQGSLHSLTGYTYYYFTYDGHAVQSGQGDNVLLNLITGNSTSTAVTTPLPAAFPLFAGGLGVIGLLARRRKQKNAAIAA